MMASLAKNDLSLLKVRIGNLEPKEEITVIFDMIGELT